MKGKTSQGHYRGRTRGLGEEQRKAGDGRESDIPPLNRRFFFFSFLIVTYSFVHETYK